MTAMLWTSQDIFPKSPLNFSFSINKPGGCAKITEIQYHDDGTTLKSYDVKYVVGSGGEKELDPALIFPFETLERGRRSRRGRDFLIPASDTENKDKSERTNKKKRKDHPNKGNRSTKLGKGNTADDPPPQGSLATTTPTTPDRKPPKSKAKRVTPIPSLVIAKENVDISPLERLTAETSNAPPVASKCRRELFDVPAGHGKGSLGRSKANKKDKKSKDGTANAIDCKMVAKVSYPPRQQQRPSKACPAHANLPPTLTKSKRDESIGRAKVSNHPASKHTWDITTNDTSRIIEKRRDRTNSKSVIDGKKAAEAILSRPRPSQSQKIQNLPISGKRVPLKDVYEEEVRKAKEFVQEVMNAKDPDASGHACKENTASKVAYTDGTASEQSM